MVTTIHYSPGDSDGELDNQLQAKRGRAPVQPVLATVPAAADEPAVAAAASSVAKIYPLGEKIVFP